jgi:predicted O-methyltransferase YrrM
MLHANRFSLSLLCFLGVMLLFNGFLFSQNLRETPVLDEKVNAFLKVNRYGWYDMNVPASDGKILHDLILTHRYTRALEIGTSTGHSGIWIAWALAKTGGKLITIEIDEQRYRTALKNFEDAGLSEYIDARLADAHELVPKLKGPFDFVFSDADKNWYKNYFLAVDPKLVVDGCYATHNVSERRRHGRGGQNASYLDFLRSLSNYETTVDQTGGGVAISYKRAEK